MPASAFPFIGPPSQFTTRESWWQRLSGLQWCSYCQSGQRVIHLQTPSYHLLFQTTPGTVQVLQKQMLRRVWVARYLLGVARCFCKKREAEEEVRCRHDKVSSNLAGSIAVNSPIIIVHYWAKMARPLCSSFLSHQLQAALDKVALCS